MYTYMNRAASVSDSVMFVRCHTALAQLIFRVKSILMFKIMFSMIISRLSFCVSMLQMLDTDLILQVYVYRGLL